MAGESAWTLLTNSSTIEEGTALDHLNNLGSGDGGSIILLEEFEYSLKVDVIDVSIDN